MGGTMLRRSLCAAAAMAALWATGTGATTGKPDLRVVTLEATQVQTTAVPLRLSLRVTMKNYGDSTGAVNSVTRLSYRKTSSAPWQNLWDFGSGAVAHNGGATWTKTFDFQEGGTYYFKAEADANKTVSESSESNNTKYTTKSFNAGTPDLVVRNLHATLTSVSSSGTWYARVEFDIANEGTGKAVGSFVNVLKVSKSGGGMVELSRHSASNVERGTSRHFTKTASFTNINSLRFFVSADDTHIIHETSEGNNTAYSETLRQ